MQRQKPRLAKDLRDQSGDYMPWKVFKNHICPVNDLREHLLKDCWCNPDYDDGLIIHRSLDGRELYENGKRKPS